MSDKLDHFTKRPRRVLTLAQEEALRLNHNYIGTEHLLLGLVREENGVAVKVLRELGVEPVAEIIRAVERTVGRGERPPFGKPTLAPRTKRVIELAVDEARLMGHHYIGPDTSCWGWSAKGEGDRRQRAARTGHQPGSSADTNGAQHPPESGADQREAEKRIQDPAHGSAWVRHDRRCRGKASSTRLSGRQAEISA